MLMLRYAPGLTDGEAWRIVLVDLLHMGNLCQSSLKTRLI